MADSTTARSGVHLQTREGGPSKAPNGAKQAHQGLAKPLHPSKGLASHRGPGRVSPSWMGVSLGPATDRPPPQKAASTSRGVVAVPRPIPPAPRSLPGQALGAEPAPPRRPGRGSQAPAGMGAAAEGLASAPLRPRQVQAQAQGSAARRGLPAASRAGVEGRPGRDPTPAPPPHLLRAPPPAGPATHSPRAAGRPSHRRTQGPGRACAPRYTK